LTIGKKVKTICQPTLTLLFAGTAIAGLINYLSFDEPSQLSRPRSPLTQDRALCSTDLPMSDNSPVTSSLNSTALMIACAFM
jgi:hypothetical protein